MSLEQLKAFLEKVKGDSNLQDKLKAAKSPEDVVEIAKEHGHEFTVDKFSLLSEEELEVVAGGFVPPPPPPGPGVLNNSPVNFAD
ncbi:nif11-like leader peptide domain protein [Synechococcus sp. BIOS-E4-1]|uniref:Nif11-like leader peptide family natural product precursor n=1 Tax=Synechococcus sp. BIOS-E4-1 TaxID=1400864 RepID=UPI001649281D|nr:Nif11-like leader peptide family natural product precursor [Synechococcus sp. BIOS-E4-1]QNI54175.1 nif11-like leader peptide domain protein [Synechococcus sp. BIOS-E4-1]